jgi:hypothetical protein
VNRKPIETMLTSLCCGFTNVHKDARIVIIVVVTTTTTTSYEAFLSTGTSPIEPIVHPIT